MEENQPTRGEYSDEMRGTLRKNEGEKKDRAPDYTGTCVISGVNVRIAMWGPAVAPKSNKKYLSLRFEYPQGTRMFLIPVEPKDVRVTGGLAESAHASGEAGSSADSQGVDDMPF